MNTDIKTKRMGAKNKNPALAEAGKEGVQS
jgi:hypothetical protein